MKNKSFTIKNKKIRIIAGKWKSRTIPIVNPLKIRPTTSLIKETLFNWLNPIISNAICLDCFAGSGALGLEALSRGAQAVTFIDKNYVCFKSLKKTIQTFQTQQIEIVHSDCRNWLKKSDNTYNIIFIDPPFNNHLITPEVIYLLEKYQHFQQQSWIYIEQPKNQKFSNLYHLPKNWFLYRKKSTNSLTIALYHRK